MSCPRIVLLGALSVLAACGDTGAPAPRVSSGGPAPAESHTHAAPHHGLLVALEDHFANLELVVDRATARVDLYVLGPHAEGPLRLRQVAVPCILEVAGEPPIALDLGAQENALTGERAGDTSQFAASHPALAAGLPFTLTVESIQVKGASFGPVVFESAGERDAGH